MGEALAADASFAVSKAVEYEYRLGQQVVHAEGKWRGVICGYDPVCCEDALWVERAAVDNLSNGRNQPFYQVLVDSAQFGRRSGGDNQYEIAYVPQQRLRVPDRQAGEERGKEISHPYMYLLFYGQDSKGDYIPIGQLREKYDVERWDDESDEDEADDPDS